MTNRPDTFAALDRLVDTDTLALRDEACTALGGADMPNATPLPPGFTYRPASEVPQAQLSPEARARVDAMIDSSRESLRRAEVASRTAVIG